MSVTKGRNALPPWLTIAVLMAFSGAARAEGGYGINTQGTIDFFNSRYATAAAWSNPDNMVARLPPNQYDVLFKPKFSAARGPVKVWVEPRLDLESRRLDNTWFTSNFTYLQGGGAKWEVNDQLTMSVERSVILWGPSLFSSPSNPFFFSTNQVNPFIELRSRDFAQVRYVPSTAWAASLITNFARGRDYNEYLQFRPIVALTIEHTGEQHTIDMVVARRVGVTQLGGFGQWTASDALLIYADYGWRSHTDALVPVPSNSPIGWELVPCGSCSAYDIVMGSSYTMSSGGTISLELRHNSQGLNDQEAGALSQLTAAATKASLNPTLAQDAGALLGQATDMKMRTLRRNYLHAQYLERQVLPNLGVTLLAVHSLDDKGTEWIGVANYYLSDSGKLSLDIIANQGGAQTEFRRFFKYAIFLGYKYFL